MALTIIFCSLLDITNWLQNHLIACPFKKLTGVDCPGCGFQRSIIALLNGNVNNSIRLYPATIPILLTTAFVYIAYRYDIDQKHVAIKTLYIVTGSIIITSYCYKMYLG